MIQSFKSKHILIFERKLILTPTCHDLLLGAGATIVGPVSTLVEAYENLISQVVDGVIIDVEVNEFELVELSKTLDELDVPFLFVTSHRSTVGPYHLIDDVIELAKIGLALFSPPQSRTIH